MEPARSERSAAYPSSSIHALVIARSAWDRPCPAGRVWCRTSAPAASAWPRGGRRSRPARSGPRPREHQDRLAGQIGRRRLGQRHHGPQQGGAGQCFGPQQQQRRGDVGAVGEADRHGRRPARRPSAPRRRSRRARRRGGARRPRRTRPRRAGGRSAACRPPAPCRAARAGPRRARRAPERQEVVSSPPVPCRSRSGGRAGLGRGLEAMGEGSESSGHRGLRATIDGCVQAIAGSAASISCAAARGRRQLQRLAERGRRLVDGEARMSVAISNRTPPGSRK